jgi:hypothetical protein
MFEKILNKLARLERSFDEHLNVHVSDYADLEEVCMKSFEQQNGLPTTESSIWQSTESFVKDENNIAN